jgi:hypothetical protein
MKISKKKLNQIIKEEVARFKVQQKARKKVALYERKAALIDRRINEMTSGRTLHEWGRDPQDDLYAADDDYKYLSNVDYGDYKTIEGVTIRTADDLEGITIEAHTQFGYFREDLLYLIEKYPKYTSNVIKSLNANDKETFLSLMDEMMNDRFDDNPELDDYHQQDGPEYDEGW